MTGMTGVTGVTGVTWWTAVAFDDTTQRGIRHA